MLLNEGIEKKALSLKGIALRLQTCHFFSHLAIEYIESQLGSNIVWNPVFLKIPSWREIHTGLGIEYWFHISEYLKVYFVSVMQR